MLEYRHMQKFKTKNIMSTNDIEGTKPSYYVSKIKRRNPLRTDDIPGAQPPKMPRYTGKRSMKSIGSKGTQNMSYDSFIAFNTMDNT